MPTWKNTSCKLSFLIQYFRCYASYLDGMNEHVNLCFTPASKTVTPKSFLPPGTNEFPAFVSDAELPCNKPDTDTRTRIVDLYG